MNSILIVLPIIIGIIIRRYLPGAARKISALLCPAFRLVRKERRTIVIEVGMQNAVLLTYVAVIRCCRR